MPAFRAGTALILLGIGTLVGPQALQGEPSAAPTVRFQLQWGGRGTEPGRFHSPIGLAFTPEEHLLVTDLNNARVQRFTQDGRFLSSFDLPLDTPPRISNMVGGIAVDRRGEIYLSSMVQHHVTVYSREGKRLRGWGRRGSAPGEFNQPGGLLFDREGHLYVADQCNHRIQKFTPQGKFLASWGRHGGAAGEFDGVLPPGSRFGGPHFLALSAHDRLYTTEGTRARIQGLTLSGEPRVTWGDKGDTPGSFGGLATRFSPGTFGPIGIAVDSRGRVWVSSLNDRVQAFTAGGRFLLSLGGSGTEPGKFARPHGLAFDRRGRLYVADAGNQRIQRFEVREP